MGFVTLDGVGKVFRGRTGAWEAVRDFNLTLDDGEFFCLLGTSGCGKTTVLNMLAGFEAPTSGRILLDGKPVERPGADRGVVFQGHDSLYDWLTALDNIGFGLRLRGVPRGERRATAERFLAMVGLQGQGAKHPSELSGGMKQRIQIARALANDPRILLMDEPFGALDAMTRAVLQGELSRIWAETRKTVLFITHDIEEACALATRVGVMKRGPGGTLKAVVPVNLPFPRERTSDGFMQAFREVHALIHEEIHTVLTSRAATIAGYVAGFALLFLIWHFAALYLVRSALFPSPFPVFERAWVLIEDSILQEQVVASMRRILQGFLLGSAIGVPLGLAIGSFRPVRMLLEPWTEFFRFIPAVAMITVSVIWFGIGEESKIFLIAYATVFVVIISTAAGVGAVAKDKIRAAQCLGASKLQLFALVALPATLPYILTGMRVAMANAFVTIVAAELVASNDGLGKMLWDARLFMQIEDIFVALIALGLLGFTTDRVFRLAIRAFAGRFNPTM